MVRAYPSMNKHKGVDGWMVASKKKGGLDEGTYRRSSSVSSFFHLSGFDLV